METWRKDNLKLTGMQNQWTSHNQNNDSLKLLRLIGTLIHNIWVEPPPGLALLYEIILRLEADRNNVQQAKDSLQCQKESGSRDEYTNAGSIFVYCTYEPSRESKFRPGENIWR